MRPIVPLCLLVWVSSLGLLSAAPEPIPQEAATNIAKRLSEAAGGQADAPFKLDVDCEKATGLHEPNVAGLLVVPVKDFKESTTKGVEEPNGMPCGYLFLYKLTPVVNGKGLEASKLPTVTLKDDQGNERTVVTLRLAVKKESEESWKLLVFGKEKKPIVSCAFRMAANESGLPLSVSTKDLGENEGTLIVTAHGKYAADVLLAKAE